MGSCLGRSASFGLGYGLECDCFFTEPSSKWRASEDKRELCRIGSGDEDAHDVQCKYLILKLNREVPRGSFIDIFGFGNHSEYIAKVGTNDYPRRLVELVALLFSGRFLGHQLMARPAGIWLFDTWSERIRFLQAGLFAFEAMGLKED